MNSIWTFLLAMKRKLAKQKLTIAFLFLFSAGQGLLYSQDLDGTAAVALQGELPDTGFFAASNRFPLNTTVDVTNLDNGKMTQVVVTKELEASGDGCLITLSRDAAGAIGIYNGDIGRVRVMLPTVSTPFFSYNKGPGFSDSPDYDPHALSRSDVSPLPTNPEIIARLPPDKAEAVGPYNDPGVRALIFLLPTPVNEPLPVEVIKPSITQKTNTTDTAIDVAADEGEGKPGFVETNHDIVLEAPLPIVDDSFWRRHLYSDDTLLDEPESLIKETDAE
jgi:hypothetical protein